MVVDAVHVHLVQVVQAAVEVLLSGFGDHSPDLDCGDHSPDLDCSDRSSDLGCGGCSSDLGCGGRSPDLGWIDHNSRLEDRGFYHNLDCDSRCRDGGFDFFRGGLGCSSYLGCTNPLSILSADYC